MRKLFILAILFGLIASTANAQPGPPATVIITASSTMTFTASADHNTTFAGTPNVTNYAATFFLKSAVQPIANPPEPTTQPVFQANLGKPTPDGTNKITISNLKTLVAFQANIEYVAFVRAIGPGGITASTGSAPFGFPGPPSAPANPTINP